MINNFFLSRGPFYFLHKRPNLNLQEETSIIIFTGLDNTKNSENTISLLNNLVIIFYLF